MDRHWRRIGGALVGASSLLLASACGAPNADRSIVDDPEIQELLEDMPADMQQEYLDTLSEIPDGSFASVRFCDGLVTRNWTNESIGEFHSYLTRGLSDIQASGDPMSMTQRLIPAIRDLITSLDNDLLYYEEAGSSLAFECVEVVSGGRGMGN